jgi:hypothetical protein
LVQVEGVTLPNPEKPAYPRGDNVSVMTKPSLQVMRQQLPCDPIIMQIALETIRDAEAAGAPLSPSKRGANNDRYVDDRIKDAIEKQRPQTANPAYEAGQARTWLFKQGAIVEGTFKKDSKDRSCIRITERGRDMLLKAAASDAHPDTDAVPNVTPGVNPEGGK